MAANNFNDLIAHAGHAIAIMQYGDGEETLNVAIECLDCNEVLLDYDIEEQEDK